MKDTLKVREAEIKEYGFPRLSFVVWCTLMLPIFFHRLKMVVTNKDTEIERYKVWHLQVNCLMVVTIVPYTLYSLKSIDGLFN